VPASCSNRNYKTEVLILFRKRPFPFFIHSLVHTNHTVYGGYLNPRVESVGDQTFGQTDIMLLVYTVFKEMVS